VIDTLKQTLIERLPLRALKLVTRRLFTGSRQQESFAVAPSPIAAQKYGDSSQRLFPAQSGFVNGVVLARAKTHRPVIPPHSAANPLQQCLNRPNAALAGNDKLAAGAPNPALCT